MLYNIKFSNKGVALFVTIALMLLLSLAAIAVLITAYNYANVTESQIKRLRAMSLAEAGIYYAFWKIRIGKDDNGNDITYPCTLCPPIELPSGYSITVSITEESGKKIIQSTVHY